MPRAVPSQVVSLIQQIYPFTENQADTPQGRHAISAGESSRVSAIFELYEQVPDALIRLEGGDLTDLAVGVGAIKDALERWRRLGAGGAQPEMHYVPGYSNLNPITLLRRALAKCPDQAPAPTTTALMFIPDAALRETLRQDISAAEQAFADNGWKAATVLAGSVVEALFLWALQHRPVADVAAAVHAIAGTSRFGKPDPRSLEDWNLNQYTAVAATITPPVIKPETAAAVNLTRNYRNLIHPGRAQRLGQVCDRGTARQALASVDAVVRDLT